MQSTVTTEESTQLNTAQVSSIESSTIASTQQVETKSEMNTTTLETAEQLENSPETSKLQECEESGIVETSITATQAIQKFETQSKSVSGSSDLQVSSHLLQETVSSRMKKVSGDEWVGERRSSMVKTGEVSNAEKENVAQEELRKVSEFAGETNKIVKSIARAKSFSAKKSSITDSSPTTKKTSVLVSNSASSVNESASIANSSTTKASSAATSVSSTAKKSSVVSSSNVVSSKKSSISASTTETSHVTEDKAKLS